MFWLKRKFVGGADVDVPLSGIQSVVAVNIKLLGGDTVTLSLLSPVIPPTLKLLLELSMNLREVSQCLEKAIILRIFAN